MNGDVKVPGGGGVNCLSVLSGGTVPKFMSNPYSLFIALLQMDYLLKT